MDEVKEIQTGGTIHGGTVQEEEHTWAIKDER